MKYEVAELLARAEAADQADVPDGMSIPDELARRETALRSLPRPAPRSRRAPRALRARGSRASKPSLRRGRRRPRRPAKSPGGKPPAARRWQRRAAQGPDQPDRRSVAIMPVAGGGFDQCYNAQAVVAAGSLLVIAAEVVQAPNDKHQLEPMLDRIAALPEELAKRTRCSRIAVTSAPPTWRCARRHRSSR